MNYITLIWIALISAPAVMIGLLWILNCFLRSDVNPMDYYTNLQRWGRYNKR